jgi:NAD(P)H dehydrogenase (quinone)
VSNVHVVYTHPSARSFTREILDSFLRGLDEAGHHHTLSDLYAMEFRSELTPEEYERESGQRAEAPIPDDVAAEQTRLEAAGVWAFVYPVWWADCPARLKGWFDRVWTVGFAYKPPRERPVDRALVLCTAGYSVEELDASGVYQAMRTVMLTDRIGARARSAEFVVFGGSVSSDWATLRSRHLARAAELGRSI